MPAIVIGQFQQLVKSHDEKVDQETRDPSNGKGRARKEGEFG